MATTSTTAAQAPAAPETPKVPKRGSLDLEQFPDEAAALAAVKDRVKGHRRVFVATPKGGKPEYLVASHPAFVGQYMFQKAGGTLSESGKVGRGGPKLTTLDAILAAMNALPEAERKQLDAQLDAAKKSKK